MAELPASLYFAELLEEGDAQAYAALQGMSDDLYGNIRFYDTMFGGVLIEADVTGLPDGYVPGGSAFFGFHIHETGDCSEQFMRTGDHFDKNDLEHPLHSGDLPPLLSNNGYAYMAFYDERFRLSDLLGRSVVIHDQRDDFTTQPSGDSGEKIACGVIEPSRRREQREDS